MSPDPSPVLALQFPSSPNATPTFTANILPVRAQAAYPVNASPRYWNPESLAPSTKKIIGTLSESLAEETVASNNGEEGDETGKEPAEPPQGKDKDDGVKVAYFRGRRLLGREISLVGIGCQGVLVSPTNTFLHQSANPSPGYDPPQGPEEEDQDVDEQPVQLLAKVGAFDSVVVWDHDKVPGHDDLFLRGLGEEGSRWRAGMHAF